MTKVITGVTMSNQSTGLSADTQALMAFESNKKSAGVAYLLWFFTGGVGGHRFYAGRTGSAVAQLMLTILGWATIWFGLGFVFLSALGIWLLVDVLLLGGMIRAYNESVGRANDDSGGYHETITLASLRALKGVLEANPPDMPLFQIVNALMALGYSEKEADWAAKQLPKDAGVSDGIRQALKLLSKS